MDEYNKLLKFTETGPYSLGLERLDYETKNFVLNAGSCLIIFFAMLLRVLVFGILSAIPKCRKFIFLERIRTRIGRDLFFNSFIEFFFAG